jgi:hypothetical protein
MVFRKGWKLKNTDSYCVYGERLEVVKEFICLQLNFKRSGEWRRRKEGIKTKDKQTLRRNDKCLMTVPK